MIEKLPFTERHSGSGEHMVDILKLEPVQPFQMQHKINELVDAVNSLRDDCNLLMGYIAPEDKCEPADPYAEQKKWIGCLCWFWFDNKKMADLGILGDIDDMNSVNPYFNADLGHNYRNCEPVSPDDDIIYKKD